VERFLVHLREKEGLSVQTSNHYFKAVKSFVRWLVRERRLKSNPLDGISALNVATDGRHDRRTSEMLQFDLKSARAIWLGEAANKKEREKREKSDFLLYKDSRGLFADFHSLRHTFITNLVRADVSPKIAQALARHSDIRLTMNRYTHIDQAERCNLLPMDCRMLHLGRHKNGHTSIFEAQK